MRKWALILLAGIMLWTNAVIVSAAEQNDTPNLDMKKWATETLNNILFKELQTESHRLDNSVIEKAVGAFTREVLTFDKSQLTSNDSFEKQVTALKGVDQKQYLNVDLYSDGVYSGYIILGEVEGEYIVVEYGETPSPVLKTRRNRTLASAEILYGGPLFSYAVNVDQQKKTYEEYATNVLTNETIPTESLLFEIPNPSIETTAAAAATQPSPPNTGYTQITFTSNSVFTTNIQSTLGLAQNFGCGPSAGTTLLYSLGQRNSSYNKMLWWTTDSQRAIDMFTMGSLLVNGMSAIWGTTFNEFKNGLTSYMSNYNLSPAIKAEMRSDTTSLGTATTTSNVVVWDNIKSGINGNKPVAVLAGSRTTSGSSYYPDTGSTYSMEFHWFTALGYIQDSDANMYLKVSTWGNTYYVSYNALCYWRNALGSVYINASY